MKTIRNMHELRLLRQKLKFQELLCEKDLAASSSAIIDNFSNRLKDLAFDLGSRVVMQLISSFRKSD